MGDLVIPSSERHSSDAIADGLLLCRIALIWRRMINISSIISLHRAKFLPLNFRILTHVLDDEAMFFSRNEILTDLIFFFQLPLMFLSFLYFVAAGQQVALIPLEGIDERKRVFGCLLRHGDYVHIKQH